MDNFTDVSSEIAASSEGNFYYKRKVSEWFIKHGINVTSEDIVMEINRHFSGYGDKYISLGVFGSVLTDKWNPSSSDIDLSLLVDLDHCLDSYIFKQDLEKDFFNKFGYRIHCTFLTKNYFGKETHPAVYAEPLVIADVVAYVDYLNYFNYLRIIENDKEVFRNGRVDLQ